MYIIKTQSVLPPHSLQFYSDGGQFEKRREALPLVRQLKLLKFGRIPLYKRVIIEKIDIAPIVKMYALRKAA